jgi:cellulose biosynthesis protein BcsQ
LPLIFLFTNNKGGVGKTTLAYNCAYELSERGYKVCLVDLDPQSNLTRLTLGNKFYSSDSENTIYNILKGIVEGGGDINLSIKPIKINEENEFYIIPGDLRLSLFENSLNTSLLETRNGDVRGFLNTSAISRYLDEIGINEKFDIFICDTGSSLGLLNNVVFLSSDYFVVPMMPDSFSVQGIENLGSVFKEWKDSWEITKRLAQHKKVSSERVMNGNALFIGYIINSYNIRNRVPIKDQAQWLEMIPERVKTVYLKNIQEMDWLN